MRKFFLLIFVSALCSVLIDAQEGVLPGKFAISPTDSVSFSRGILSCNNNVWSFSPKQYVDLEYFLNNTCLFRWSYQNSNYGMSDEGSKDIVWEFKDWGENAISNGSNQPNVWRTLSFDEWEYLLMDTYHKYITITSDTTAYVYGIVLLPKDFEDPTFTSSTKEISEGDWISWEKKGAVFFQDHMLQEGGNHFWTSTSWPEGDYLKSYQAFYINAKGSQQHSDIYYFDLQLSVSYEDLGSVRLVYGTPKTTDIIQIKSQTQISKMVQNGRLLIYRNGLQYDIFGRLQ